MLLVGAFGVTTGASPATATVTTLCKGYVACAKAGMPDGGYSAASKTMWWRMYTGHNCTNYAAYRIVKSGLPNTRPWSGSGNATNWGAAMSRITNSTPTVGSIAWWRAGVKPAGSAGHVAYVERVVSADELIVSQDSWRGDFSWTRVTRAGGGWPSGFVHFNDVPLLNIAPPSISGTPKVGSVLTAAPGAWSSAGVTFAYQWSQDGVAIAGATGPTLTVTRAMQGKKITVRVTATNPGYPAKSVVSAQTTAVQAGVLSSTTAPTLTGDPRVDATLTATPGAWTPAPDEVRYQWRADGAPLPGATAPTLTVAPAQVDRKLSVTVTALKSGYAAVATTSAATGPAQPGALEVTDNPVLAGTPRLGQTLTLRGPSVPAQATAEVQWLRRGVPVPGATAPTYRLTAADLGAAISAQVRLTRPGYAALATRTEPTPLIRSTPVIRLATQPGPRRLAVTATVTAPGVSPVAGAIQIRARGKLLSMVPLRNGVARTTLTGLPRGPRTFRFRYVTTAKVSGAMVPRRVRIA